MGDLHNLRLAKKDLRHLERYLLDRNIISMQWQFSLEHDEELDADNILDPRAFCAVMPKSTIIYCSKNIDLLPPPARIGILLHEIAHVVANAFGGDESEVDCDVWIKENVPESGYAYRDVKYAQKGATILARNLQVVSDKFVKRVSHV